MTCMPMKVPTNQGSFNERKRSRSRNADRNPHEGGADPIAKHVCHREVPHFGVVPGQLLCEKRYYVRRLLGEGTFGRVLSCVDLVRKEGVAVKVVKGVRRYCEFAEAEAEVLKEISRCDPGQQSHCVRLLDSFLHPTHHFCLVFERLGVTMHEFMLKGCPQGLLVADVRAFSRQLLQCLTFLHGLKLSHTDIKCRNVMLRDARYEVVELPRAKGVETRRPLCNELVVIDFGGALFAAERGDGKVGTRHYRAPEIVLGLPWDEKADVWSVGCLVALGYLGERPMCADEDFEQLALMERLLGSELPRPMAREALGRGGVDGVSLSRAGRLEWPRLAPEAAAARVAAAQPLRERVRPQHRELLTLLEGTLHVDPARRLTAEAAADLPFSARDAPMPE